MSEFPISIMGGGGAPVDASYVVVALTAGLTSERQINAGTGIAITDNGANSTIDIALSGGGGAGVAFVQGGNSFGVVGTLGTNDNNNLVLERNSTSLITLAATALQPFSNDLISLGVSGTAFADLYLASGSVIDFAAGDVTLTHAANLLTLGGGDLQLGGNVLIGNSTASGTLTLRATSSATDGAIIFQTDPTTEAGRILSTLELAWGRTTLLAATDIANFAKNQNSGTALKVENTTDGTAASTLFQTRIGTGASVTATNVQSWSTTFTTNGMEIAGAVGFYGSGPGLTQVNVGSDSSVPTTFWAGTERMRITTGPTLLFGLTATSDAASICEMQRNQNNGSMFQISNTTDGTAAGAFFRATVGSGATLAEGIFRANSTSFTSSGIEAAGACVIRGLGAGLVSMNVGTSVNVPLTLWTNNVERARITTDPVFLFGLTTPISTTDVAEFRRNQNVSTVVYVDNQTDGTGASSAFISRATAAGNVQARTVAYSTSFTTGGIEVAGAACFFGGGAGVLQVNVGSTNNTPFTFWMNNIEQARFAATTGNFHPATNDGISLGISGTAWADLFLASGGVLNWAAGNVTLTHAASALTLTSAAAASGSPTLLTVTGAAHTGLTASTEAIDVNLNLARTVQFATGALTTQRAMLFQGPTYAFVAASTLTDAVTVEVLTPLAGTNATITQASALRVQAGIGTARARCGGVLSINTTAVGNVGIGEDDLITYSLVANSLSHTGKGVRIRAWGTAANNANVKTLKLYFGTQIVLTTSLTASQVGTWSVEATVWRTGSSTQDWESTLNQGGATTLVDVENGTAAQTDSGALTIKCTGEATADNDIVNEGLLVEMMN